MPSFLDLVTPAGGAHPFPSGAMGFVIPGIEALEFNLAPTASGDVVAQVEFVDAGERGSGEATMAKAHPYPLPPLPSPPPTRETIEATHARPISEAYFAALASKAAAKLASSTDLLRASSRGATQTHRPSAPRHRVVPILPRLDPSKIALDGAISGPAILDASSPRSTARNVGWKEEARVHAGDSASSSSMARAPGDAGDFVRGSLSNAPFTPGGAGWNERAAAAPFIRRLHYGAWCMVHGDG